MSWRINVSHVIQRFLKAFGHLPNCFRRTCRKMKLSEENDIEVKSDQTMSHRIILDRFLYRYDVENAVQKIFCQDCFSSSTCNLQGPVVKLTHALSDECSNVHQTNFRALLAPDVLSKVEAQVSHAFQVHNPQRPDKAVESILSGREPVAPSCLVNEQLCVHVIARVLQCILYAGISVGRACLWRQTGRIGCWD